MKFTHNRSPYILAFTEVTVKVILGGVPEPVLHDPVKTNPVSFLVTVIEITLILPPNEY